MDEIPYTIKAREDSGLYNAKLGIWLFLSSEVMLFGALFSTYIILRIGSVDWPLGSSILHVHLGALNTLILISSSITMIMAWVSLKQKKFDTFRLFQGATILLTLVFLGIKLSEYSAKFHHHLYPSHSTFMAIYFTLTGVHALHILGGLVVNSYNLGPGSKMWKTNPEQFTNRIEISGLYWHFVDLVWLFLFPVLYLT